MHFLTSIFLPSISDRVAKGEVHSPAANVYGVAKDKRECVYLPVWCTLVFPSSIFLVSPILLAVKAPNFPMPIKYFFNYSKVINKIMLL